MSSLYEIEKLLDSFGVEYRNYGNRLAGACPIHNGDNKTAFTVYDSGVWQCYTGGCHEHNGGLYGLVRLLLKKKGLPHSRSDVEKYVEIKPETGDINFRFLYREPKPKCNVKRESILSRLEIPAPYFLTRRCRFKRETLEKYDVGTCLNPNSKFFQRAVVPIYDLTHTYYVGCTARTINDEQPKWLHDTFKRDNSLYNSWFAKDTIARDNTCILVESPGNVWRLEESGIQCGLAMYGTQLSFGQMRLLAQLGVLNIVLALDNDEAGKKATASIVERLKGLYNIIIPKIEYEDLAECPVNYLTGVMGKALQEIQA